MTSTDGPRLRTEIAYAGFEEHGFCGYRLYRDLAGRESLSGMLAIATGAPRLDANERGMLDDLAAVVHVADPRIWPLKIARLVASYGRSFAGYAAGNVALDGARIGVASCGRVAARLAAVERAVVAGETIEIATTNAFLSGRRVLGFGVPFRPADERVVALTTCVERRGFAERPYWRCLGGVVDVVRERRGLEPNIGVALSAVALDLGFLPEQVALLGLALASNTFLANVREAAQAKHDVMRRLPDDCVEYVGVAPRVSPRGRRR